MNFQSSKRRSRLTSKCQVTIPKDIRDALGLKALDFVDFAIDEDGNARILKADGEARAEQRKNEFREGLQAAQHKFGGRDRFMNMDGLEYQRWIRPDRIDI